MRIVAGRFRGRTLAAVPRSGVRPTADPVREALFNILGDSIVDGPFVDIGAGTGAVGLEACSRGARPVLLIERDRQAVETIRRNVERLGLDPAGSDEVRIVSADALAWLRGAARQMLPAKVRTFFLDPPYGDPALARWIAAIAAGGWLEDDSLVVVEHRKGTLIGWGPLQVTWTRRYGDTALTAARQVSEIRL